MIAQNPEKVKSKVKRLVSRLDKQLTVPQRKFVLEMVLGMLGTGSSNLTRIAAGLREPKATKHTLKRLQRMLCCDHILEAVNDLSLREAKLKVGDETVLALDNGDVAHLYGKKFENLATVHDGSSGEKRRGYWLNQVSGYNESSGETFPLVLDMYSVKEAGYKSATAEAIGLVDRVVTAIGKKGLWVADRGYDSSRVLAHLFKHGLRFMVRMRGDRHIWVRGQKMSMRTAADGVNRRVKFSDRARFGSVKAVVELGHDRYEMTLVVYKDSRNREPIMWMVPGHVKSTVVLKRCIRGYFRRWGVEESYRFEKQGFGIEKATVRRYRGIKTLLGLSLLSWLALIRIQDDGRLRREVLRSARMEKEKRRQLPKFKYYRLLQGVKNMLSGIRRLFLFRWKKRAKMTAWMPQQPLLPLFSRLTSSLLELEYGL
jgi:hypothetical protein